MAFLSQPGEDVPGEVSARLREPCSCNDFAERLPRLETLPVFFRTHFSFLVWKRFGDLVIEKRSWKVCWSTVARMYLSLLPEQHAGSGGCMVLMFLVFVNGKQKMKETRNQQVRLGFTNKFETLDGSCERKKL